MPNSRYDVYAPLHKAMRLAMGEGLALLGRADVDDTVGLNLALDRVDELLHLLRVELRQESDHIYTAIEARHPGGARQMAGALAEQCRTSRALQAQVSWLRAADPERRPEMLQSLYQQLSLFVADNLNRMARQESAHSGLLQSLYSDEELGELQARQLAGLRPDELQAALVWMTQALGPRELIRLLNGVRELMFGRLALPD